MRYGLRSEKYMAKAFKRVVVGILSANGFENRRESCRRTWVADLAREPNAAYAFMVGGCALPAAILREDTLHLACADDYASLPQKTRSMIQWAIDTFEFDYLFKCDDDTYVSASRLMGLDLLGRDYVGAYCSGYAQGGAGYFLSRRAAELVAGGLSAYQTGPEDLLVGRILKNHGIKLSSDWRFRRGCRPDERPRPGNMIITAHECRSEEMDDIQRDAFSIASEINSVSTFFTITAWATDYGMLGTDGHLGFWVEGRDRIRASSSAGGNDTNTGAQYVSAHANSRVVIHAKQPVIVFGFLDIAAGDRSGSEVKFIVGESYLGTIRNGGDSTREIILGAGTHTFDAKCVEPDNIERRYSVWSIRLASKH
jgi:hypothetical protein